MIYLVKKDSTATRYHLNLFCLHLN